MRYCNTQTKENPQFIHLFSSGHLMPLKTQIQIAMVNAFGFTRNSRVKEKARADI